MVTGITGMNILGNITNIDLAAAEFSTEEAFSVLQPLVILIIGIVLYAWFIFKFYRFLARKNIFRLNLNQYNEVNHPFLAKIVNGILYVLEYLMILPLCIFFWFLVVVVFISLISTRQFQEIMIAGMALVAATRIGAYYNEDLSKDLAKMIPFALLGIFIIDVKLISFVDILGIFQNAMLYWKNIMYFLLLTIILEIILRLLTKIMSFFKDDENKDEEED